MCAETRVSGWGLAPAIDEKRKAVLDGVNMYLKHLTREESGAFIEVGYYASDEALGISIERAEESLMIQIDGTSVGETDNMMNSASQGRILRLAVLPLVPKAGVDVGGDEDLGSQQRNIIAFDLDLDFVTIEELKHIRERELGCSTGEVIEQKDFLRIVAIEPSGVGGLAVAGGADRVVVINHSGLTTSSEAIVQEHQRGSISSLLVKTAEGGYALENVSTSRAKRRSSIP